MRFISQLIKDIPRVLQKLLNYFNGTAISTFFLLLLAGVRLIILDLNLNDLESVMLPFETSFWFGTICTPLDIILASQHQDFFLCLFGYYLFS